MFVFQTLFHRRLSPRMLLLVAKKLIQGVIIVFAVSAITFALLSSVGGDVLSGLRDNPQVSEKTIDDLTRVYGLDRPFAERYKTWLTGVAGGDLGESLLFRIPVRSLIWSRLSNTSIMAVTALAIAVLVAFVLALLSARYKSRVLAGFIEFIILLFASTPRIVLALVALIIILRFSLGTISAGGGNLFQLMVGSIVLGLPMISILLAQLNDGLKTSMGEDFVQLARAKGLSEWKVIIRHAVRPAINPFLTMTGLSLGSLLGGSVIVETVLGWPGIGALMVAAVKGRDIPVVMGVVLFASLAVWLGNSMAELLQLANDKRLRDEPVDLIA